jgi:hypothetical protein
MIFGVPSAFIGGSESQLTADVAVARKFMEYSTNETHTKMAQAIEQIFWDVHWPDVRDAIDESITSQVNEMLNQKDLRDETVRYRVGLLLKKNVQDALEASLLVKVHYAESTTVDKDTLLVGLTTGVFDHDTYCNLFLASNGISASAKAKLSERERKEITAQLRQSLEGQQQDGGQKRPSQSKDSITKKQKQDPDVMLKTADDQATKRATKE